MKKQMIIMIALIMIFLPSIVTAAFCTDRADIGQVCNLTTPSLFCPSYTYDIIAENGTIIIDDGSLTLLNNSIYYFPFNQTEGDYVITLCDDSAKTISVSNSEVEKVSMIIGISIFLIGITLIWFYLANNTKDTNFKIGYTLIGFLFVIADLFFASNILRKVYPAYAGIAHNMETMYGIALYLFVFMMTLAAIYLLFRLFRWIGGGYKQDKMKSDEDSWLKLDQ